LEWKLRRLVDLIAAYALVGALLAVAVHFTRDPAREFGGLAYAIDGDTLWMAGERLRLVGIDAPELDQLCEVGGRAVACGRASRDGLRRMIVTPVTCVASGRDRYERPLVNCQTAEGDIASRMVAAGLAVAQGCCAAEEAAARGRHLGIWAGRFERPADWRHARNHGFP
jgi:endonuclease YncB( thermonuclease family)